jgi:hypothetical protein
MPNSGAKRLMELNRMELIAPQLQFPLISSDCAENWPEPLQRHLKRLVDDHLIYARTDTPRQKCELRLKKTNFLEEMVELFLLSAQVS